jgi:thiol-disulfide isomerase/thioredoxin
MKDLLLGIVIVVLIAPSNLFVSAAPVGDKYDLYTSEGMVAIQSANTDFSAATPIIPERICQCNGTKKQKSGDGLIDLPCVCGDQCSCKKPNDQGQVGQTLNVEKTDVYTSYYFTAKWCGPCQRFKSFDIPVLVKSGWKIVEDDWSDGASMVIIDIEKNPAKFAELREPTMELIPTFVVTKNGKVLARRIGYVGNKEYAEWYNKVVTEDRNKK